jgi:hypothetical protein
MKKLLEASGDLVAEFARLTTSLDRNMAAIASIATPATLRELLLVEDDAKSVAKWARQLHDVLLPAVAYRTKEKAS